MTSKYCPCCGEPIMVGQEECLNCRVYLWPAEEKDRVKHGMGDEKYSVSPGLLGGILTDLGVRSIGELMEGREEETLDVN